MRHSTIPFALPFALPLMLILSACDPRGVSLGNEEPCVGDPRLTAASINSSEMLSPCAFIAANALSNAGFESPPLSYCGTDLFCQLAARQIPPWQTDDISGLIELWGDGYQGVPSAEGTQFVELNATSPAAIWQDLSFRPGTLLYWSIRHRGRDTTDTLEVSIGPPDALTPQGDCSSATDAWYQCSGLYRVGPTESLTRFLLRARSPGTRANLIDDLVLAPIVER